MYASARMECTQCRSLDAISQRSAAYGSCQVVRRVPRIAASGRTSPFSGKGGKVRSRREKRHYLGSSSLLAVSTSAMAKGVFSHCDTEVREACHCRLFPSVISHTSSSNIFSTACRDATATE
jgi:hypothetical protein